MSPRSAVFRPRTPPVPVPLAQRQSPRFGEALLGSTLGVAVGGTLGVLMIRAAANDAVWEQQQELRPETCCGLQRLGLGLLGGLFAAGGGPFGAAKRIDRGGFEVYAPAGAAELLIGGLGYALGRKLAGTHREAVGAAVGGAFGALGAAGGAVLGASASPETESGGLRYQEGQWRLGVPSVRAWPSLGPGRSPTVRVSGLTVQL